jgi:hypothetical protein
MILSVAELSTSVGPCLTNSWLLLLFFDLSGFSLYSNRIRSLMILILAEFLTSVGPCLTNSWLLLLFFDLSGFNFFFNQNSEFMILILAEFLTSIGPCFTNSWLLLVFWVHFVFKQNSEPHDTHFIGTFNFCRTLSCKFLAPVGVLDIFRFNLSSKRIRGLRILILMDFQLMLDAFLRILGFRWGFKSFWIEFGFNKNSEPKPFSIFLSSICLQKEFGASGY